MRPANGHANGATATASGNTNETFAPLPASGPKNGLQFSPEQIKELTAALELPFDPSVIEWRVTNTAKGGKPRGQVIPYADQRAYTDRLHALVTPAGWTRKYAIHTSANFQRGKDQTIVAKILVTCELTIFGLGSHSATGEEWADDDNAGTSAEAQAFKRACSCFGLGRYLYHFSGVWVDRDERKRPKSIPQVFGWATPQGWRQGLRPGQEANTTLANSLSGGNAASGSNAHGRQESSQKLHALVREIEPLAESLGKRLYRGILKRVARAWSPAEILDSDVLGK